MSNQGCIYCGKHVDNCQCHTGVHQCKMCGAYFKEDSICQCNNANAATPKPKVSSYVEGYNQALKDMMGVLSKRSICSRRIVSI